MFAKNSSTCMRNEPKSAASRRIELLEFILSKLEYGGSDLKSAHAAVNCFLSWHSDLNLLWQRDVSRVTLTIVTFCYKAFLYF